MMLLTPKEVGELFGVGAKTVTRWAKSGKLSTRRTLGGHRRFLLEEVEKLLASSAVDVSGDQDRKPSA